MDLEEKLDSFKRTELLYVAAGLLLVAVAAVGLQYQDSDQPTGEEEEISVSLTIDKADDTVERSVDIPVNATVFDAVNSTFAVEYTEYDFGYFITSIDGLEQNETHSWLYSVNNESATTSVNNYVLQDGDDVEFRYTANQP